MTQSEQAVYPVLVYFDVQSDEPELFAAAQCATLGQQIALAKKLVAAIRQSGFPLVRFQAAGPYGLVFLTEPVSGQEALVACAIAERMAVVA